MNLPQWSDEIGYQYRPDKCEHPADDGCMWCCMRCNTDTHWCPGCGTVTDHKGTVCEDCQALYADHAAPESISSVSSSED